MPHAPRFVTHDGSFHPDDVLAYAVLARVLPRHELIRTRDVATIAAADVAFDVGGGRYDHHMRDKPLREDGLPYSSAGLIWRDFGHEYVARTLREPKDAPIVARVHAALDERVFRPIDAIDNGVTPVHDPLHLALIVDRLNPTWTEMARLDAEGIRRAQLDAFRAAAAEIAAPALDGEVRQHHAYEQARAQVLQAARASDDPRVLELRHPGMPFERIIHEEGLPTLFVKLPASDGTHVLHTVATEPGGFTPRQPLPEAWAGLRDADLEAVTGIPGSVFCHTGRFIAVARDRLGTDLMCAQALKEAPALVATPRTAAQR